MDESLWEDHHHKSSFLPSANSVDFYFVSLINYDIVKHPQTPLLLQGFDCEGNFCNINQTIPINISV